MILFQRQATNAGTGCQSPDATGTRDTARTTFAKIACCVAKWQEGAIGENE